MVLSARFAKMLRACWIHEGQAPLSFAALLIRAIQFENMQGSLVRPVHRIEPYDIPRTKPINPYLRITRSSPK